jgi:SCY1-like protein 2
MGIKIRGLEALRVLCGGGTVAQNDDGFGDFGESRSKAKNNSVILDKYTIQEKVVPLLKAIKTKEPAVMTAALDVFQEIGKIADSDFLATDVLPILWNFSLGPLLNLQQFQAFMTLIKGLSSRIEQEHTRKLQEMTASNPVVASRNDFMSFGGPSGGMNGLDDSNGNTNDFEALVLGKKGLSSPAADSFDVWNNPEQIPSNQLPSRATRQPSPTPPAFSWSSPSPTTMGSNTSFTKPPTTTQPLNSFSVLQPQSTSTASLGSQNLTATRNQPTFPTLPMSQSSNAWATPSMNVPSIPNANAWSTPTMNNIPSMVPINPWSASQQTSTFNQPMRPTISNSSSFSIPPPPTSPYSTFGIAPPPANNITSPMTGSRNTLASQQNQHQPQQQSGQKQGLEKYESLI